MNVRNCRRCGKLFNYVTGQPICPKCREAVEKEFQEVKKYIQDNPGCDIPDVAEACDVDPVQIRQWIREDRLQFSEDSPVKFSCENCGALIRSGRFCEKCKTEMANGINAAMGVGKKPAEDKKPAPTRTSSNRMRFL